jgi:hypothetical protein
LDSVQLESRAIAGTSTATTPSPAKHFLVSCCLQHVRRLMSLPVGSNKTSPIDDIFFCLRALDSWLMCQEASLWFGYFSTSTRYFVSFFWTLKLVDESDLTAPFIVKPVGGRREFFS